MDKAWPNFLWKRQPNLTEIVELLKLLSIKWLSSSRELMWNLFETNGLKFLDIFCLERKNEPSEDEFPCNLMEVCFCKWEKLLDYCFENWHWKSEFSFCYHQHAFHRSYQDNQTNLVVIKRTTTSTAIYWFVAHHIFQPLSQTKKKCNKQKITGGQWAFHKLAFWQHFIKRKM